jgi:hypothetical protein
VIWSVGDFSPLESGMDCRMCCIVHVGFFGGFVFFVVVLARRDEAVRALTGVYVYWCRNARRMFGKCLSLCGLDLRASDVLDVAPVRRAY